MHSFEGVLAEKPTNIMALLGKPLLGLDSISASKTKNISEQDREQSFLAGAKIRENAFNANQKNAAVANVLRELFLRMGSYKRALKLAERTIPFAGTLTLLTEGNLKAARFCMQTVLSKKPPSITRQ
ncbi:hypothetical protein EDB19DRAFT_1964600 [Suillus lakei]|nr:hypothetical protein EDB19DRAFT_1964600 [Suillus lakei]